MLYLGFCSVTSLHVWPISEERLCFFATVSVLSQAAYLVIFLGT